MAIWQLTGATQSQGGSPDNKGAWSSASGTAAAVCLVGVASIAAVTEASATLFRFINIGYCNLKIRTLLVVVGIGFGGRGFKLGGARQWG